MDRSEIITELYTLRAGLSLISQETDKYNAEVAEYKRAFDTQVAVARGKKEYVISRARNSADVAIGSANRQVAVGKQESLHIRTRLQEKERSRDSHEAKYRNNEKIISDTEQTKNELQNAQRKKNVCLAINVLAIILYLGCIVLAAVFSDNLTVSIAATAIVVAIFIYYIVMLKVAERIGDYFGTFTFFVLDLIFFVMYIVMNVSDESNSIAFFWATFIGTIVFAIPNIICLFCLLKYWAIYDKDIEYLSQKLTQRDSALEKRESLRQDKERAEREYQEVYTAYQNYPSSRFDAVMRQRSAVTCEQEQIYKETAARAEAELKEKCNLAEIDYNNKCKASAELHGAICTEIRDALVQKFGGRLDVRDWGMLDLLIYQLETGRAETLKEALQLSDREKQTDRIVDTMKAASMAIAVSIDDGFGQLRSQLSLGFSALAQEIGYATCKLSSRIESSTRAITGRIEQSGRETAEMYSRQIESLRETNKNIGQLFSQSSLQTALLEMSNKSSSELIKSMNEMKNAQSKYLSATRG